MLTVRGGVTRRYFARNVEPIIHVLPLVYSIGTAVYGQLEDMFVLEENGGLFCWVDGATYVLFFGAVPVVLSFAAIVVNNIIIYFHVRTTLRRTRSSVLMGDESQDETIAHVAVQAFLYVGTFMLSYVWTVVLFFLQFYYDGYIVTSASIVAIHALYYFCYPLQGFWNAFVFVRPRYVRYRKLRPEHTRKMAMLWALFGDETLQIVMSTTYTNPDIPCAEKEDEPLVDKESNTAQERSSGDIQLQALDDSGDLLPSAYSNRLTDKYTEDEEPIYEV